MTARQFGAGALLAVGLVLVIVGTRSIVETGTCSSTGFTEFGPAPTCPSGSVWDVVLVLAGAGAATFGAVPFLQAAAPAPTFAAIGLGALVSGESFGYWFGPMFLGLGALYWGLLAWVRWSDRRYEQQRRR